MRKIEEECMVIGKFLLRINFLIFVVLFLLGWNDKAFCQYTKPKSHFFFPLKSDTITLDLRVSPKDLKDLSFVKSNLYSIQAVEIFKNHSRITLNRNLCEPLIPQIKLAYKTRNDQKEIINIFFFSKRIDIDKLSSRDTIVFDKKRDIVPPLLVMSSLQVGNFILCDNGESYKKFETLKEFYLLSYLLENGEYQIAENNCEDAYFSLIVK